ATSTLFPYTTLFRSATVVAAGQPGAPAPPAHRPRCSGWQTTGLRYPAYRPDSHSPALPYAPAPDPAAGHGPTALPDGYGLTTPGPVAGPETAIPVPMHRP